MKYDIRWAHLSIWYSILHKIYLLIIRKLTVNFRLMGGKAVSRSSKSTALGAPPTMLGLTMPQLIVG